MGWIYITHMDTKDGRLGFCTNPWIPDPTQDYARGGSATNPSQAEFNAAMLVDEAAINLYTMDTGTHRWELDDTYYLDLTHNGNTTSVTSNLPDFYGFNTAGVINRRYLTFFMDKERQLACFGWITYNDPANYTSSYKVCFVPYSDAKAHQMYLAVKGLLPKDAPYSQGGYSEAEQGGEGSYDDTSDTVSIPGVPALNLSMNHFISAYVPDLTQLNALADWIWGNYNKFDSNAVLAKIFTQPMDAIMGLIMLPFTPSSSTAITVTIGNFATSVSMPPLSCQFKDISCGSLSFAEYWGNYLDYNPYTKISLILPFVGQVELDPDEVMGETVSVDYRVDCLTGAFVCFVSTATKVLGQYSGNCALSVPITSGSYAQMNAAILGIAATAAAGFSHGAFAAMGSPWKGANAAGEGLRLGFNAASQGTSSAVSQVGGMKLRIQHSGGLTGAAGFLGVLTPYVIIHRPRQSVPEDYEKFRGYPSNVTLTLSECTGFTSVRDIVLDGIPFTEPEIAELDGILKGGIFI